MISLTLPARQSLRGVTIPNVRLENKSVPSRRFVGICLLFLLGLLLAIVPPRPALAAPPMLQIYVDDEGLGHVFFRITDSAGKHKYYGFRPLGIEGTSKAVFGNARAFIANEEPTFRTNKWNVASKQYSLKPHRYEAVREVIRKWLQGTSDQSIKYNLLENSCGDFARAVATAAGVGIDLPWSLLKDNRPGNFASYLRSHGGTENIFAFGKGGDTTKPPPPKQAYARWAGTWQIPARGNLPAKTLKVEIWQRPGGSAQSAPEFGVDTHVVSFQFEVEKAEFLATSGNWELHCVSSLGKHRFNLTESAGTLTGVAMDEDLTSNIVSGPISLKRVLPK